MRIEDFYDVPDAVVLLVGGPRAGERIPVRDGLWDLLMPPPEPVDVAAHLSAVAARARRGEFPPTVMDEATRYSWTGSILDDGTRVFVAA